LETLQWDVLPHPLYSSDITPSDYRAITRGFPEQHFVPISLNQSYNKNTQNIFVPKWKNQRDQKPSVYASQVAVVYENKTNRDRLEELADKIRD
jgi:hypothetical protein